MLSDSTTVKEAMLSFPVSESPIKSYFVGKDSLCMLRRSDRSENVNLWEGQKLQINRELSANVPG